jgi:hypothetical protein
MRSTPDQYRSVAAQPLLLSDVFFGVADVSVRLSKVGKFIDHGDCLARPMRVTDVLMRSCPLIDDRRAPR